MSKTKTTSTKKSTSKSTSTSAVKKSTSVKAIPAPQHVPISSSIVPTAIRSPDYLVQKKDCTLDGCLEKAHKKKQTKLKINYKKMFN